jgi:hypothetical protein
MSKIIESDLDTTAQLFSAYFHHASMSASYKPILLKAIFTSIKQTNLDPSVDLLLIPIEKLAVYFLNFNFTLKKRFHLHQLNDKRLNVKIYQIIENFSKNPTDIKIPRKLPQKAIKDTITLLFRNVIYLLRKDLPIYDFYNLNRVKIALPVKIKDESDFSRCLRDGGYSKSEITHIGIRPPVIMFVNMERPILETAILAQLAGFLEKLNTVPNLIQKLMIADQTYSKQRNIKERKKKKLFRFQENRCFYCGRLVESEEETLHADHFVPYSYLFDSQIWNIVGACVVCNLKKSNSLVSVQYLSKLLVRNADARFFSLFFYMHANEENFVKRINDLLKMNYRNCEFYFKKIELKNEIRIKKGR